MNKTHMAMLLATLCAGHLVGCSQEPATTTDPAPIADASSSPVAPAAGATPAFEKSLSDHGLTYRVSGSQGTLSIVPEGLAEDNSPITVQVSGVVENAWTDDINVDQFSELYVVVKDGPYRKLMGWASNSNKSLTEIYVKDLNEYAPNSPGYAGGDEYLTAENTMIWRFPIKDPQRPALTMRQLQLKLAPGEAGWILQLNKVVEW